MTAVGYDQVEHLVRIPVEVDGVGPLPFLVDTGIGVSVVSPVVAERLGLEPTGEQHTGRRMSGQAVTTPLVRLPALSVGGHAITGQVAGSIDLGIPPDVAVGILGLRALPRFVLDAGERTLTVLAGDDPLSWPPDDHRDAAATADVEPAADGAGAGPAAAARGWASVPLHVEDDGPSTDPFVDLELPSGRVVRVEVDTGSEALILDTRFLPDCGIDPDTVEFVSGTDQTGAPWRRHIADIAGAVALAGAPGTRQESPRVIFQEIIHDGLVGTAFLLRTALAVDVPGRRLALRVPASGAEPDA
ncbi:MAG: hypothetical protein GC157_10125 [Frankiales bacterium]|nr:hypothetical protein [Frankiales bacterium]